MKKITGMFKCKNCCLMPSYCLKLIKLPMAPARLQFSLLNYTIGEIANTRGSLGTTRQFGRYDQDSNDRVALHAQQLDGLRGEIELLGRDAQVTKDLLVEASNRLQSQAGQLHVHETAQNTVLSNLEARVHKLERKRDRTVYDRNIDQLIKHDKVGRK